MASDTHAYLCNIAYILSVHYPRETTKITSNMNKIYLHLKLYPQAGIQQPINKFCACLRLYGLIVCSLVGSVVQCHPIKGITLMR